MLRALKEDQLLTNDFKKAPIDFSFLRKETQSTYMKSKYWLSNPYHTNHKLREALHIWTRWVDLDVYLHHLLSWSTRSVSQRQLNGLMKLIIDFNNQTCDPCLTEHQVDTLFTYVKEHPLRLNELSQYLHLQLFASLERMIHRHHDFLAFQLSK